MKEIGEYLRQVREEKNISLKDIQEITKISLRYLEAIDRGDFKGIPGEVYIKGFIANYAAALGLDGQEVLQRYNQLKADQEEQLRQAQLEAAVKEKSAPQIELNWSKEVYLGIVGGMIGLLIILSFFAFPSFNNRPSKEAVTENITSNEISPLQQPITVDVTVKERVWVQLKTDEFYPYTEDGTVFDPSTSELQWTAQKEMEIKVGNPAGISLKFNGKDLGYLGEAGVVKTIKLTPKGLVR